MSQKIPHPSPPRILAIETSGRLGSLALARGHELLATQQLSTTARHAAELMPTLARITKHLGWQPAQIDHIYLSLGPGSFTGLRIAVALARAMAQATHCKLVGVPSLDVIAQNAPPEFQTVIPILDAKRGQVFSARYQRNAAGRLTRATDPALVNPRAFLQAAPAGPIALLGEGVDYHREALFGLGARPDLVELDKNLWPGRAEIVHHLGWQLAQHHHFTPPQNLLPIYIRLPEAEEVWRKKHNLPL